MNQMEKNNPERGLKYGAFVAAILLSIALLSACMLSESPSPQVAKVDIVQLSEKLEPGLSALYTFGLWRHINQMPKPDYIKKNGKPGKPITSINHRFGRKAVFDSKRSQGVGILMTGYLLLDKKGTWEFKVHSNDGIVAFINQFKVVDDPEWHSDRFSEPMAYTVDTLGYHPFQLQYFQRKGTATLEFYWKAPGEKEFSIVPSKAYWHK